MGKTNLASATLLQTKLYLYTSYVLGGRVAKGAIPDALFWDTASPYHYLRLDPHRDYDYAIFGGEDHKTGQAADTEQCYRALEGTLRQVVPEIDITHRWSGQVIETNDGLPFIGETSSRQFAATGYAGNGMTFGTLAGVMARDAVLGRRNPWERAVRHRPDQGQRRRLGLPQGEHRLSVLHDPRPLRRARRQEPARRSAAARARSSSSNGEQVAASRDDDGKVTLLSPICTHMGCRVDWNEAERTWDCPCHGSRFKPNGDVLSGPAESPLEKRAASGA